VCAQGRRTIDWTGGGRRRQRAEKIRPNGFPLAHKVLIAATARNANSSADDAVIVMTHSFTQDLVLLTELLHLRPRSAIAWITLSLRDVSCRSCYGHWFRVRGGVEKSLRSGGVPSGPGRIRRDIIGDSGSEQHLGSSASIAGTLHPDQGDENAVPCLSRQFDNVSSLSHRFAPRRFPMRYFSLNSAQLAILG
jgi:hypothetical protein